MKDNKMEKHNRVKLTLKIVGISLVVIGAIMTIIGLVDFFRSFGEGMPTLFGLAFAGIPMLAIGASITIFAFRREVTNYIKNESAPVFNEMTSEIRPGVEELASAVKDGLDSEDTITCECGTTNDAGSKYCKQCGKPLTIKCDKCGADNDQGSNYCNNCGAKL